MNNHNFSKNVPHAKLIRQKAHVRIAIILEQWWQIASMRRMRAMIWIIMRKRIRKFIFRIASTRGSAHEYEIRRIFVDTHLKMSANLQF